jgi:hypothetical protein
MSKHQIKTPVIYTIVTVLLAALLLTNNIAHARSIGGQVVDDIRVSRANGTLEIHIDFLFPVHYQWRFPKDFNNQIMIALQPVKLDPRLSAIQREDLRVPDEIADLFQEIYIDTTEIPNLLLYLQTTKHINPEIKQARSSAGIIISISKEQIKSSNDSGCNKDSPKK